MTASCIMLCETRAQDRHGSRQKQERGSGLVDLGNLRHGNGGKNAKWQPLLQCSYSVRARDAGQGALGAWQHGLTGRWYDVIKPILIDIQHPCLSDPCQLFLPVSRRPIEDCASRTFEDARYVPTNSVDQGNCHRYKKKRRLRIYLRHLSIRNLPRL